MKIIYFFTLLSLSSLYSFAQLNQEIEDAKHEQIILIDEVDKDGFMLGPYQEWFMQEHESYQPDKEVLEAISILLENESELKVLVFMSTWCSDSREQMPRFYKIIESLKASPKMKVYALDENKTCPSIDTQAYNVERVPTFIFYSKGKEIGRIIETPKETLEKDFLQILRSLNK